MGKPFKNCGICHYGKPHNWLPFANHDGYPTYSIGCKTHYWARQAYQVKSREFSYVNRFDLLLHVTPDNFNISN